MIEGEFMYAAVRPYATAGVALLGAGVIAISPVAPMPDLQALHRTVSSANIELYAMVNPIERWVQVWQATSANLSAIGQQVAANPAPILAQIIANQVANATELGTKLEGTAQTITQIFQGAPTAVETAVGQFQAGNIKGAVDTLNNAILIPLVLAALQVGSDALIPVVNTVQNVANVVATLPNALFAVALPLTYPLLSAVNALVQTTQDVVDAAAAGDAGAVVNALVNAPANLVDGVLNGAGTILGFLPASGILTPYDPDFGELASGPIATLIALRETIAKALGAPATPAVTKAVASVPTATATTTVTLATPALDTAGSTAVPTKAESTSPTTTESSTGSADSTSTGTHAVSSAKPGQAASPAADESSTGSDDSDSTDAQPASSAKPVKRTHGAAKPNAAHDKDASSVKADNTGTSASTAKQD
jgi:hypothetical protein